MHPGEQHRQEAHVKATNSTQQMERLMTANIYINVWPSRDGHPVHMGLTSVASAVKGCDV